VSPFPFGDIADDYDQERHRIDVDCRRTDRTQSLFIASPPSPTIPGGTPGLSQSAHRSKFSPANDEVGAQSQTNEHVEKLCEILLTYDLYEKNLGEYARKNIAT
jgi:TBC1 domain family member 15